METADQLTLGLQQALQKAEDWTNQIAVLRLQHQRIEPLVPGIDRDLRTIRYLRTRASSSLLTVAFLGGFSSGKSFLVSGLQQQLKLEKVRVRSGLVDKYVGVLPSSPKPTSSCPAGVIPLRVSTEDPSSPQAKPSLRVRFADSQEWEERGIIEAPMIVAAYATDMPELVVNRRETDRQRRVAEIEMSIQDYALPARFYDLPGVNVPNRVHDAIVRERMEDADCFVYVTKATGTLSEADLELIRSLYQHHKASEKRIIWVVTAIDLADDLGLDDEPNWKATVTQNNSYLEKFFPDDDGRPDRGFIGQGFLGVSPALEAQAAYSRSNDPDRAAELQAESRMDDLRRLLVQIIESETGLKYAKKAALEARLILQRHRLALLGTLAMERVPFDRVREETLHLQRYAGLLDEESSGLRPRLEESLRRRIKSALRSFDESGLTAHLHQELGELIRSADLRKADVINQIEIRKTQVVRDWLSTHGLLQSWEEESNSFATDVLLWLRERIGDAGLSGVDHDSETINMDLLTLAKSDRSTAEAEDLVQKATGLAGTIAPLAGGAAAAVGIASGALLLLPVGTAVAAAGLYGLIRYRKQIRSSLDVMREEEIQHLDKVAKETKEWFILHASLAGEVIIDRSEEIIEDHRRQLAQYLLQLRHRATGPEAVEQQEFVNQLDAICKSGSAALQALSDYAS